MQYSAYPNYQGSNLAWVNFLPAHWGLKKLKFVCKFGTGWTPPTKVEKYFHGENLWATIGDMEYRYIEKTALSISDEAVEEFNMFQVQEGSLLYSFKLSVGKVAFVAKPMYTNEAIFFVLPSENFSISFLYYLFPVAIIQNANENIYGAKILNQERIKNAFLTFPPLEEQQKIAAFLDYKTQQIDQLIEKKKAMIENLEEKRIAVITQAVTKGLDKNAKLKPSGVDWLGDVPAEWGVMRLRFLSKNIEQGWSPQCHNNAAEEGSWGVMKVGCVNGNSFDELDNKELPDDIDPREEYEIFPGDILISRANTKELLGSAALVDENVRSKLLLCDKLYRLKVDGSIIDSQYLLYVLRSKTARFQYEQEATGASGSMQNIGQDTIKNVLVVVPPIDVQKKILNDMGERLKKIDALVDINQRFIGRIEEYRSAIITSAVTGKIDVRAVNIPKAAA